MSETTLNPAAPPRLPEFPTDDGSRIPYEVYNSKAVYDREQERLFRGPIWIFLALEAEIPNPFDFKSTFVGDTPVVVTRDEENRFSAWVNRCAHRGALVCRESTGNARSHACVYHQWSYTPAGDLEGVPFRRGKNGTGMPKSFDPKENGLHKLRVESYRGLIFGTFDPNSPDLSDYLGNQKAGLDRIFHKPIEYLGCTRQCIKGNWKLYLENTRDGYHASLLHAFHSTFNLVRQGQRTSMVIGDNYEVHNCGDLFYTEDSTKGAGYAGVASFKEGLQLENPDIVENWQEFDEIITNHLQSIFPQLVVMQIQNVLAVREVIPKGVEEFELIFNFFGYADDTPEMRRHRISQFNLVGPAGLISMEDGEAVELVQRATNVGPAGESIALMALEADQEHTNRTPISEDAIRHFWIGYQKLMGL
jgi:anthranilate 1,2-dioxygenase large subunit